MLFLSQIYFKIDDLQIYFVDIKLKKNVKCDKWFNYTFIAINMR